MAKRAVICDTDVLIDYLNKNSLRHSSSSDILENAIGLDNAILSAITKMELIIGATNKDELRRINKNIYLFRTALINDAITELGIQLLQKYRLSHGLALPDALIAATAIILEVELFTHNIKDYKFIDDLMLYDTIVQ